MILSTRESQFSHFVEHPLTHVALVAQVAQSSFKSEYMKTPPGEICRMDVVGPPPPSLNLFFTQNSELQASNLFPLVPLCSSQLTSHLHIFVNQTIQHPSLSLVKRKDP